MLGRSGCLSRPQSKEQLFPSRDVCWRATSVQTHFFDSGSAAAVGRQERWTQRLFTWLAKGEDGGELRQQRLRTRSARGGKEKALHRKLCGEAHWGATYACGRKCENALELQGERAPAESPGQLIAREPWMHLIRQLSTLDKRRRRYGRAGVHTENALKQTRRQRFGVARRKTSERSENTRGVAGRAAFTGRVGGEIQEELKHPSDCWCVPVCWVWSDSKEECKHPWERRCIPVFWVWGGRRWRGGH